MSQMRDMGHPTLLSRHRSRNEVRRMRREHEGRLDAISGDLWILADEHHGFGQGTTR